MTKEKSYGKVFPPYIDAYASGYYWSWDSFVATLRKHSLFDKSDRTYRKKEKLRMKGSPNRKEILCVGSFDRVKYAYLEGGEVVPYDYPEQWNIT